MKWRKPAACGADEPKCLEIADAGEAVVLRGSRNPDEVVVVHRDEFAAHVAAVKAGEYDDLT